MRQKNLRVNRNNIGAIALDKKGKSVVVNHRNEEPGLLNGDLNMTEGAALNGANTLDQSATVMMPQTPDMLGNARQNARSVDPH